MTTTATRLPLPYHPGGSPWVGDKTTARILGFLTRYLELDLDLPEPVADRLEAYRRFSAWVDRPVPDAQVARQRFVDALLLAARNGGDEPDVEPVIVALARADAQRHVARDLESASAILHTDLIGSVRHYLDDMLTTLAAEHDALLTDARAQADLLPASVTTADLAVAAGPEAAAAWLALADIGARLRSVRACRGKIGTVDHPRGSETYLAYQHPERFPKDEPVQRTVDAVAALDLIHDRLDTGPWCPTRPQLVAHLEAESSAAARQRQGPNARSGQYTPQAWWAK